MVLGGVLGVSGFRVWVLEFVFFSLQAAGVSARMYRTSQKFGVSGYRFRVEGLGLRVTGLGFRGGVLTFLVALGGVLGHFAVLARVFVLKFYRV